MSDDATRDEWWAALEAGLIAEEPAPERLRDQNDGYRANGTLPAPELNRARFLPGGSWILDHDEDLPTIWGTASQVLWPSGEPMYVVGPPSIGKTTLVQRLTLHRIGVAADDLLGYPVHPSDGKVLYLAADRPRQAQRSFRRMVTPEDRARLDERLVVWQGPPPADLAQRPALLTQMAAAAGCTDVVLDSLKDMAAGLASDEVGAGLNIAVQLAIADGYEVMAPHHQRKKEQGTAKRPKSLDDVYGSTWITSGAGSVILLWGEPGDLVVELDQLKAPQDAVSNMKVALNLDTGALTVADQVDLVAIAGRADNGITAVAAASALFSKDNPTPSEVEKARRRLQILVKKGLLDPIKGETTTGGTPPIYWRPTAG